MLRRWLRRIIARHRRAGAEGFRKPRDLLANRQGKRKTEWRSTAIVRCRGGEVLGQIIEHDLVEVPHRLEDQVTEVRAQIVPERSFGSQFLPCRLE